MSKPKSRRIPDDGLGKLRQTIADIKIRTFGYGFGCGGLIFFIVGVLMGERIHG